MNTKELGNLSPTNFDGRMGKQSTNWKSNPKLVGDEGENLACEYLVKNGYKVLERNYRISFGEIDIIARKKRKLFSKVDKTIHFVEVKTIVSNKNFFPEERVDYKKQRKLKQLAEIWLEKNRFPQNYPYQIDIIGIVKDLYYNTTKLRYIPNAVEG